jgi:hypothetical protein
VTTPDEVAARESALMQADPDVVRAERDYLRRRLLEVAVESEALRERAERESRERAEQRQSAGGVPAGADPLAPLDLGEPVVGGRAPA